MREFEEKFAAYLGGGMEAVAVNSATAGLDLAAEACGVGPGDSVVVPTLTFTATAKVVSYLGAEVVLVDVEPGTHLLVLADAECCVTPRCKAIMPVHFGGLPCDMEAVLAFARRHGLKVIEDGAHALPARRDGRFVGASESDTTVFSFYANKTITTGEGGMLVARDPGIAARTRPMPTHGVNRDSFDRFRKVGASWAHDVVAPGFKYNMSDVAAAIGVVRLAKADALRKSRQMAALQYFERLAGLPLALSSPAPKGSLHCWHLFQVRIHESARVTRDDVIEALAAAGIGSSDHYLPLHMMTYWKERYPSQPGQFPVADRYFVGAVTLPLFPGMTDAEIECGASLLHRVLG